MQSVNPLLSGDIQNSEEDKLDETEKILPRIEEINSAPTRVRMMSASKLRAGDSDVVNDSMPNKEAPSTPSRASTRKGGANFTKQIEPDEINLDDSAGHLIMPDPFNMTQPIKGLHNKNLSQTSYSLGDSDELINNQKGQKRTRNQAEVSKSQNITPAKQIQSQGPLSDQFDRRLISTNDKQENRSDNPLLQAIEANNNMKDKKRNTMFMDLHARLQQRPSLLVKNTSKNVKHAQTMSPKKYSENRLKTLEQLSEVYSDGSQSVGKSTKLLQTSQLPNKRAMSKINRATNEVNKLLVKRKSMFNMIAHVRNQEILNNSDDVDDDFSQHILRKDSELESSINPCQQFDEKGRLVRWSSKNIKPVRQRETCCYQPPVHDQDLIFVSDLEIYEKRLFENLEMRQRAIKNWKRLRVVLVMLRLAGGKATSIENPIKNQEEEEVKESSCVAAFAFYIIDPMNPYRITFEIMMGFVYLLVFVIDPYILAARFHPLEHPFMSTASVVCTILIMLEIFLRPIMGRKKEDYNMNQEDDDIEEDEEEAKNGNKKKKPSGKDKKKANKKKFEFQLEKQPEKGINDPDVERDVSVLFVKYLKEDSWLDIPANIPFLLFIIINGLPTTFDEIEQEKDNWVFNTVMAIKLLRLAHMEEINETITRLMQKLADVFWRNVFLFDNLRNWILTILKFVMSVHYFACGYLLIHRMKEESGYVYQDFTYNSDGYDYAESLYLVTTTISTVGYGDFKGYFNDDGDCLPEMLYMYLVTLFGIILFSSVTKEIFTYKKQYTVQELVKMKCNAMEDYLNSVSSVMKTIALDQQLIDECKEYMTQATQESTRVYFEENSLWQELPQNLQFRIVKIVLWRYMKSCQYFLNDYRGRNKAPLTFLVGVLTNLDCQLFKPDEIILEANKPVEHLILIEHGDCNLYGFTDSKEDPESMEKHLVVRLPRRSWYGEFQILLNLVSSFQLEANKVRDKHKRSGNFLEDTLIKVYQLPAHVLLKLCDEYPDFRRFVLLRATMRRTHFLKVFQELRHTKELMEKREKDKQRLREVDGLEFFGVENFQNMSSNEAVSEQLINGKLLQQVQHLINRQFYEFKKATSDKKFDPQSLKSRVEKLDLGFNVIQSEEMSRTKNTISDETQYEFEDTLNRKGRFRIAIVQSMMEASVDLTALSKFQWSSYMTSCDKWMCNFMDEERDEPKPYIRMTSFGFQLMKQALLGVQQIRSLYLNVIEKEDIWDSKNQFRNEVNRLIQRENFRTETMQELEQVVIKLVKQWIDIYQPKSQHVDGPWKAYVQRFSKAAVLNDTLTSSKKLSHTQVRHPNTNPFLRSSTIKLGDLMSNSPIITKK